MNDNSELIERLRAELQQQYDPYLARINVRVSDIDLAIAALSKPVEWISVESELPPRQKGFNWLDIKGRAGYSYELPSDAQIRIIISCHNIVSWSLPPSPKAEEEKNNEM